MKEESVMLKIECNMSDPKGLFIEKGTSDKLTIYIKDSIARFSFKDKRHTKKFALFEIEYNKKNKLPTNTYFRERTQDAFTIYPGKSKEKIQEIILDEFKRMGLNVKK